MGVVLRLGVGVSRAIYMDYMLSIILSLMSTRGIRTP